MDTPGTLAELVEALSHNAEGTLGVYDKRGRARVDRPYPEVARRARAWGAWLEAQGVRAGDIVFLCLPTSHDLVEGFLGASLVGALPCCLALPRAIGGLESFKRRVEQLTRFGRGALVTTPEVGAELGTPFLAPPRDADLTRLASLPRHDPRALAYIQLTSGSTSAPKAVSITHENLARNTRAIVRRGEGSPLDTYVAWLPLYHDMGLVGILFCALFHGASLALMAPETFVGSPLRWLEAIATAPTRRGVITSAPNFGYQWCVDRVDVERTRGLDLSRWVVACCGAEMIRPGTVRDFQARFAPCGFDPRIFIPCYGMAEATLAVTMTPHGRGANIIDDNVSCGPPVDGMEVTVRPVGSEELLPDGQEGELVLRGSSIFAGYYRDPEATAAVLRPDGCFRSGDLGYLKDGELHVTGRVKDLLIIDGANVAPHELEWLADAHVDMDGGRAAAFSIERDRREAPVLVVECKEVPPPAALDALRAAVAREVAPLFDLVLVRRGTMPKTSSGKVQRGQVRARYLDGTLEGVLWRLSTTTGATT